MRVAIGILVGLGFIHALLGCADISDVEHVRADDSGQAGESPRLSHDFGEVNVDGGLQQLRHTFEIQNTSDVDVRVLATKRTCGCVVAEVSQDVIPAGGSIEFVTGLDISTTGLIEHGATLVLSDDTIRFFRLRATGFRKYKIKVIPRTVRRESIEDSVEVCLYVIDRSAAGENLSPTLTGPQGISMDFHGWTTIEDRAKEYARPTRQVGRLNLSTDRYLGDYPVDVTLRMGSGQEVTVTISR